MIEEKHEAEKPPAPAYRLSGVSRRYGSGETAVYALDSIDLEIGHGEFVTVVGSSGSGKSTLLTMLGALDRPSAGSIEFEGRDLSRMSDAELGTVRLGRIGFVFQQFNLIPVLSAQDNVEVAMAPTGLGASARTGRAIELLERVGLGSRTSHLPSELSGGEQQRVAIARALANNPDVLLADEPTGNLDSTTGETILELIGDLWTDEGLTVVLITHDREIAASAPRQVVLADGRVSPRAAGGQPALAGTPR